MTGISAEEYLRQLGNINAAINQDIRRLEEMRMNALSGGGAIRYDKDKVQGSAADTMGAAVISIVDLDARINQTIDRYVDAREKIIEQIRGLHNELYTKILYDIYVKGMNLRDTADDVGRSYNNVMNHRKMAVALFGETYAPFDYLV